MNQKLIFTNLVGGAIDALVDELGAKDVFVLTDTNTSQFVMPLLVNVKENSRYYRRFSLRENAYLVLKPVEIYGSLSSYRRVDRAEKRCWHIDAPHAALEGRRCA